MTRTIICPESAVFIGFQSPKQPIRPRETGGGFQEWTAERKGGGDYIVELIYYFVDVAAMFDERPIGLQDDIT